MPASEKPNPNGFGFSVSFAGKALYLRSQRQTAYQYGAQYPHPAAADARSGHLYRFQNPRPPFRACHTGLCKNSRQEKGRCNHLG